MIPLRPPCKIIITTLLCVSCFIFIGCQKNYYLIEEAYYQGHYLKTVHLINQLAQTYPKQIKLFLAHSEKRLCDKLVQQSEIYISDSPFQGLCYIKALRPELAQIQIHFPSSHFQRTNQHVIRRYSDTLPSFLKREENLGVLSLSEQDYFIAAAHFKRYLHFQENDALSQHLDLALSKAQIHLVISPFDSAPNSPELLFGVNVIKDAVDSINTEITLNPISFVRLKSESTPTSSAYTLVGTITSTYKDTQVVPELITRVDTLRYQHDVGGIPQWDDYEFEYIVERVEFLVTLEGLFTITSPTGSQKTIKVTTNYGHHSQYRKETLNLPHDSYRIEFPAAYNQLLEVPLLIEEDEIVKEAIHIFSTTLYKKVKDYFGNITSSDINHQCHYLYLSPE